MMCSRLALAFAGWMVGAAVSLTAAGAVARLEMDTEALTMTGSLSGRVMPRSGHTVEFSPQRPAEIAREPAYLGTPWYGRIVIGNGPRSGTWVVVDRAPDDRRADNRIYIDHNQNGDLSDDGDGVWQNVGKNLKGARVGPHFTTVRGSWGEGGKETSTAEYGLMLLFGADKAGGADGLFTRTAAVRTGSVAIEGRSVRVALVESGAQGDFSIAGASDFSAPFTQRGVRTVTLLVDVDGDGEFGAVEVFDATKPIRVGERTYEASTSMDGARLEFQPTDKVAQVVKAPVRAAASTKDDKLVPRGSVAPEFTALTRDGALVKLSDYRGKIVVLDFWATWCIPCIRSMPHVQKTVAKATAGDVVWLGVCVWDDRASFDRWVPLNDAKYAFTKLFDPAGKDRATSIAGQLYRVSGIPTLYVIDREGKIVEGFVGYLGDDDHRLEASLRSLGAVK
ncbi:MAG: TlpA disulfide reductase family protein [Opitutaceae bacterium]